MLFTLKHVFLVRNTSLSIWNHCWKQKEIKKMWLTTGLALPETEKHIFSICFPGVKWTTDRKQS